MPALLLLLSLLPAAAAPQHEVPKRAFPKLHGKSLAQLKAALGELRVAKKEATLAAAQGTLAALGSGAVPACLNAFRKLPEDRLPLLEEVLDGILSDADLDLAWAELGRRSPAVERSYLTRRYAQSSRKDALSILEQALSASQDAEGLEDVRYQAARGLVLRGSKEGLPALHAVFQSRWGQERKLLRADLAHAPRGPLAAPVLALARKGSTAERLAGLRLFQLLGTAKLLPGLRMALRDPDPRIKLAMINACRILIDHAEALDALSVMDTIDQAREWDGRL